MITLYHAPQSRSSRIIWLLEEVQAPYTLRPVTIFRPQAGTGSPDPGNPHPDRQVPAIEHHGGLITESIAIGLYLTDAFPQHGIGPMPGDPDRGSYLAWLAWYAAALEPAIFANLGNELDTHPMKRRAYDAAIARLDSALARGPFLLGERFSAADIMVGSAVAWARRALPDSSALDRYAERCRTRPAALRAADLDEASGVQRAA